VRSAAGPGQKPQTLTSTEVDRVRASAASERHGSGLLREGLARRNGFDSGVPTR
jgi:hypothetical protein